MGRRKVFLVGLGMLSLLLSRQARAWVIVDDQAEGSYALRGSVEVVDSAALDLRLMLAGDNGASSRQYYLVQIRGTQATIAKVDGDQTVPLGLGGEVAPAAAGEKVEFAVYRDGVRIALIWGRRVVARGYDAAFHGPSVGYDVVAGGKVEDAVLQVVEDIEAGDNFEKEETEERVAPQWEPLAGTWTLQALREDRAAGQMRPEYSANAFSYFGSANGVGLATMGYAFWRDCQFSAAVRARAEEVVVGLAFYVQDKDNYLLLRWDNEFTPAPGGPHLKLVAVVNGQAETLAERQGGYWPDQWYLLCVDVCDEHIACSVDGEVMLQATTSLFGCGMIGLYVEGKHGAWFDDVHVTNWNSLVEDFGREEPGKWVAARGAWAIGGGARPTTAEPSLLECGSRSWARYRLTVQDVRGSGGLGLVVCYRGPQDYLLFRWAAPGAQVPYAGKAQIVQVTGEGEQVLDEGPLEGFPATGAVAEVVSEPGYVAGMIAGAIVAEAVLPTPAAGAVGLYAEGVLDASFGALRMTPLVPRRPARVTKEFTETKEHFEMAEWAATTHAWIRPASNGPQTWLSKGDYYGPLEVRFTLKQVGAAQGTLQVAMECDERDPNSGVRLSVTAMRGTRKLLLKLTAGDSELGAAEVEAEGETCPMSLERRGSYVVVTMDGKVALVARKDTRQ